MHDTRRKLWHLPSMRLRTTNALLLVALLLTAAAGTLRAQGNEISAVVQLLFQLHTTPYVNFEPTTPVESPRNTFDFYYLTANSYQPLQIESNVLTKPIEYRGAHQFTLYTRTPATAPGEADTFTPVLSANLLPAQGGQFIIVGLQTGSTIPAALYALPISAKSIPRGNVLSFNLGGRPLFIATEAQRLTLPPLQGELINIPSGQNRNVRIMAAIEEGNNDFQLIFRRRWDLSLQARALCIFYPTNDEMTSWNGNMIQLR